MLEHTKYLKSFSGYKLLKFVVLPNGLSSGSWKLKNLKVLGCFLKIRGNHYSYIYIYIYRDDLITIGETCEKCVRGSMKAIKMFLRLGFLLHPDKITFSPSQEMTYLAVHIWLSKYVIECNRWQKRNNTVGMYFLSGRGVLKDQELVSPLGTLNCYFP